MTWQLDPGDGADRVTPQGHTVMCLLQRPQDVADVEVVLKAEVTIAQTLIVFHRRIAATREPSPYRLSFTDNTFVRLSG
jgi:hypothetical protein